MTISPSYPYTLQNGTTADASQVMADFNQIQSDVNANAAPLASPGLTGSPTVPTALPLTNSTIAASTAYADAAVAAGIAALVTIPSGVVADYAGTSAPSGWLLCFGQSLARTGTYANLFAAIGTNYGSVDGTHFNVPDYRGNIGAGADNMGGSAASRLTSTTMTPDGQTLGATGGAQARTSTSTDLAAHTHTANVSDPSHSHTYPGNNSFHVGTTDIVTSDNTTGPFTTMVSSSAATGISVTNTSTGSGAAYSIIQPTLIVNKIIKT